MNRAYLCVYVAIAFFSCAAFWGLKASRAGTVIIKAAGIAINADGTRAFVTDNGDHQHRVIQCSMDPHSGSFSHCDDTGGSGLVDGFSDDDISTIRLNAEGTRAFVMGRVSFVRCAVDPATGAFSDCGSMGTAGVGMATDMVFKKDQTRVLITDALNRKVMQCGINPATGRFFLCMDAGLIRHDVAKSKITGIALDPAWTYALIADPVAHEMIRCRVDSHAAPDTPMLSDCKPTAFSGARTPSSVVFNAKGTRVFITDFLAGRVIQCAVHPVTNVFSGCTDTGANGLFYPAHIVLDARGTHAFLIDARRSSVVQCSVHSLTGTFSNCGDATKPINPVVLGSLSRI